MFDILLTKLGEVEALTWFILVAVIWIINFLYDLALEVGRSVRAPAPEFPVFKGPVDLDAWGPVTRRDRP